MSKHGKYIWLHIVTYLYVTHNCHFSLVYLLGITRPRTTMKRIENHLCISLYLLLQERNSLYQKLWDSLYFKGKVDKHYTDYICRLSGFSLQLKLKVIAKIQEWHREKWNAHISKKKHPNIEGKRLMVSL